MDATLEQVFAYFIFDAYQYIKGQSLRLYITVYDITRMIEGDYE